MQSRLFLLSNSSTADPISSNNGSSARICNQFHPRTSTITCASSSNKGFLRSQRQKKTLIRLIRFAASNLHHVLPLPEPFNSVIREFAGGGGSGGSWKGFRWGGFDGGGGGRKRRVNKKPQFWLGFVAVCWLGFWWLNLTGGLELKSDVVLMAMCLFMFLVLIWNGCVSEWGLGFCSGGFVAGVLFEKKDELQKLVRGFKAMGISRRKVILRSSKKAS